jgi:hypothetical protein
MNAEAWTLKAGQHDLTSGRVLFVRIALECLRGAPDVGVYVGQAKTLLTGEHLDCLGGIDPVWDVPDVLAMLRDALPSAAARLLAGIAEALNDRDHLVTLDRIEAWSAAPAVPLEAPWPEEAPGSSA